LRLEGALTLAYVLLQNLTRSRLRTALTAVTFALLMGIFVLALSLVAGLRRTAKQNEQQLRLGVRHKVAITNLLPDGVRRKIEELDPGHERVLSVCGMRWFGGRVPGTQNALTSLASDADTFPVVYPDAQMTAADIAQWHRERRAAVVGAGAAEQYGWKIGQRVELESVIPPYLRLEFQIIKIIPHASPPNVVYFRRDYLVDSLDAAGVTGSGCNIFWVKCTSATALRSLQKEIDAQFANSPNETKSEDENAVIAGFIQGVGDIPALARTMAIVVIFITALVAGNTMTMSFRERTRELAVFKAIGFRAWRVFSLVLSESLLLALLGSLLGIVPVCATLLLIPHKYLAKGSFSPPELSVFAVVHSLLIGLFVGAVAGVWPAYRALRLRTTDALRRVA
jgi:putative ABC transport system permease protein